MNKQKAQPDLIMKHASTFLVISEVGRFQDRAITAIGSSTEVHGLKQITHLSGGLPQSYINWVVGCLWFEEGWAKDLTDLISSSLEPYSGFIA